MSGRKRAVFLDRDGTLNAPVIRDGKPYPPANVAEFSLLPGVSGGCSRLNAAGYVLVVATNQPDVGRGEQSQRTVEEIHQRLVQLVPELDRIEVCYDAGRSTPPNRRRKPLPGMLLDASAELGIDLACSWMVGDRWRDVECGRAAGCRSVFIDYGYNESLRAPPDFTVRAFSDAVDIILANGSVCSPQ
jgi:D-glycero-D-manno-heptose 1,7-bisphosphate phosphatase